MDQHQKPKRDDWRLGRPLAPELRTELAAFVAEHGEADAIARLRMPRTALARGLGGLNLRAGNHELFASRLAAARRPVAA